MQPITIKKILYESLALYRKSIPSLFTVVVPLIAIADLLTVASEYLPKALSVIFAAASFLASSFATALSIKTIYSLCFKNPITAITPRAFFWYLFIGGYLAFVFSLTASIVILIIPALLVLVFTSLGPIFILEHQEGPFQSIGSSAECLRGNLLKVSVIMLCYLCVIGVASAAVFYLVGQAGVIEKPLSYMASVLFSIVGLYHSAVIVVLYQYLHPNKSLKDAP